LLIFTNTQLLHYIRDLIIIKKMLIWNLGLVRDLLKN